MSIASMASGDTVDLLLGTPTRGDQLGESYSYSEVSGQTDVNCRVSNPSASETQKAKARNESFTHQVFFSQDIGIQGEAPQYMLRWKKTRGNKDDISPPRFLRVTSYSRNSNVSGSLSIWIANCNEETLRDDSSDDGALE